MTLDDLIRRLNSLREAHGHGDLDFCIRVAETPDGSAALYELASVELQAATLVEDRYVSTPTENTGQIVVAY